jgi:hypothetical protein
MSVSLCRKHKQRMWISEKQTSGISAPALLGAEAGGQAKHRTLILAQDELSPSAQQCVQLR